MQPFQARKKLRNILYAKTTLFALFVLVVLVGRGAWGVHQKALIAISGRDQALSEQHDLEGRTAELQASLAHLKSSQGVEEELRQKFTVAHPGESVVVVVDESDKTGKNTEVGEGSFWDSVVNFFKL